LEGRCRATSSKRRKTTSSQAPLRRYKDTGIAAAIEAPQQISGRPTLVVLFTPKTGPKERMFFDAETFTQVRSTSPINLPQTGGTETLTGPVAAIRQRL
jgi:hypothetical protein